MPVSGMRDGCKVADSEPEPVNFQRFCSLLQEHKENVLHCSGHECAMLFGSTGVGKSTLLHLLAGSVFRQEAVQVTDDAEQSEFGTDIDFQLVTEQKIPGSEIGNSATSMTLLLNSYPDASTGLTYVDTPGFNNVGVDNDDVTIDAANSAAIMHTIRTCSSLRIVFLISVKDELNTTKAGAIRSLFEVMGKFIRDASKHLSSVLMLFTHCDGYPSAKEVLPLLNRIGRSKALPEDLMPFLRHAIQLLSTHGNDLLVRPAEEDAQTRMDAVRKLLQKSVQPMVDTAAVLQCPLSEDVLRSLELACARKHAEIVRGLNSNRVLVDARPLLEDLGLLHGALRLPKIEQSYTSALREMVTHAEQRVQIAMDALAKQSFLQVRNSLSIFSCNLGILAPFMQDIGLPTVMDEIKRRCTTDINSTCDKYVSELDDALSRNDFDAAATLLGYCHEMIQNLEPWCLFAKSKRKAADGAHQKVRRHTKANTERALGTIRLSQFNTELCGLLDVIRQSSEHATLLKLISMTVSPPAGAEDYTDVAEALNARVVSLSEKLAAKFEGACIMTVAQRAFVDEFRATRSALEQMDAAMEHVAGHLRPTSKEAIASCRKVFTSRKDSTYDRLRGSVQECDWKEASALFACLKGAEKLGSPAEQRHMEVRLEDIQNLASTTLGNLVERLSGHLGRDDFGSFMQEESLLANVKRLKAESVLREASLQRFTKEHNRLLQQVEANFAQTLTQITDALELHRYDVVVRGILHLEKMAEASVQRTCDLGCAVPNFNKRVKELLHRIRALAKSKVDECKKCASKLNVNASHPTEAEVVVLSERLGHLHYHRQQVFSIYGAVPSLSAIVGRVPPEEWGIQAEDDGEKGVSSTDSSMEGGEEGTDALEDQSNRAGVKKRKLVVKQEEDAAMEPAAKRRSSAGVGTWEHVLGRMLELAEAELRVSLEVYAADCQQRCTTSLEAKPKPFADDILSFLGTLETCQRLDGFVCSVSGGQPSATATFEHTRKAVVDGVKKKFTELRDACGRNVRANKMAEAQANLEAAREMLVLRDTFAGDAITLDAAVEEMRGQFDQKVGAFARSVGEALSQERFAELRTLLLGYRDLVGAAEQEEFNCAVLTVRDAGDTKYTMAIQTISSINDDRRSAFPPSMEQMAAALRWIESARCLGEGDSPILGDEIRSRWESAFDNLKGKLELLRSRGSKLEEWKFAAVEETHRRLGQLLMLRFPVEISETINTIRTSIDSALQSKVDKLESDVRRALEDGDYLTIDLIFDEVKGATQADSSYVSNRIYNSLVRVLESFLDEIVQSIKDHFVRFEVREAHTKQEHLWKLERAAVAGKQVARAGLDILATQKKKSMISRMWLREGNVDAAREKINGFRDVDPVMFSSLVAEFMDSFDGDIKRLRKVETKADVLEVEKVVREIPRIASILESEQAALKKSWEELWNSFIESVKKKHRLVGATSCQKDGEQDVSDSIAVLQAARDLLVHRVLNRAPGIEAGVDIEIDKAVAVGIGKGGDDSDRKRKRKEVEGDNNKESGSATPSAMLATTDPPTDFSGAGVREGNFFFSIPNEDSIKGLVGKLNEFLGQITVDSTKIDSDWVRYIENFDCSTEGLTFVDTLSFIRKLKMHHQAIRACGEYGWNKQMPTADRAVSRIHSVVADRVKELDEKMPECSVIILHNLNQLIRECSDVFDDDVHLQSALNDKMIQQSTKLNEWVEKLQRMLAGQSKHYYALARKQVDQRKRKESLNEVVTRLNLHQRLVDKLIQLGIQKASDSDTPLVSEIKSQITEMETQTRQIIARKGLVEDIADSIHGIYMTAMDLDNATILKHSESCIGSILNDCKTHKFELQEIGLVLERDFPQGSEITHNLPQFTEFNLLAFQKMCQGKTVEGTVQEVAQMNGLPKERAEVLLRVAKEVMAKYENIMHADGRFSVELEKTVTKIKREFSSSNSIPSLIGGVFAIWSLASKTEQCPTPRMPLPIQIVAIIRLLALDKPPPSGFQYLLESWFKKPTSAIEASHLAQIKTGQGKSVVLGTLATVLSTIGYKVDCVCYSAYLSQRDKNDFEKVFALFDVSAMVNYGTFQQLSERLIDADGDVRAMTRDILVATKKVGGAPLAGGAAKGGAAKGPNARRVLLVDEVDVFFSKSFYGETYDPVERLEVVAVADLQRDAWSKRGNDSRLILSALTASGAYHTLMQEYPQVKVILAEQIAKMVRDLETWKTGGAHELFKAYRIIGDKIAYKSGVNYDSKICFGYVTLWTYFHEVECRRLPATALEGQLGLMIECGQFSYAEIPKRYDLILGVTGTLVPETKNGPHPLGEFEQEIIRDDYKITGQTDLPSVFGEKNLTFRENEHVSVLKSEDEFNNAIGGQVAKALDGRPVLVFFESEAKLDAWQQSIYGGRVPPGTLQCIKSDSPSGDMDVLIRKATHAGQVTLLSREHGRGLDFHCLDRKVDDLGGLHVVQTFLSEELSEEIQIRGRTARQKNKGSFQMLLLVSDLDKFGISLLEIEQKEKGVYVPVVAVGPECSVCLNTLKDPQKLGCGHAFCKGCVRSLQSSGNGGGEDSEDEEGGGSSVTCPLCRRVSGAGSVFAASSTQTMYQFLHAKRAIFLDSSSVTRREAVSCAKALHDQSVTFQKNLVALSCVRSRTPAMLEKCLKFLRARNIKAAKCRLLCLSDATASMGSTWSKTQDSIRTMLERIAEMSGGAGNISVKWLAYRDYEVPASKVLEASPWTDDPASLVKFVGGIRCISEAGCDWPEAVEAALQYANNEAQPPTRVVLIGDAPPHSERKGNKIQGLKAHASNVVPGGFLAGGVLSTDYRAECALLASKGIKVYSFYLHSAAKAAFDEISSITGGESQAMNNRDTECLIHAICENALEDIGGAAMRDSYRAQYRT